jgi:hypothetical protein
MSLIRITGSQLHAARVLVGLSRDTVSRARWALSPLGPRINGFSPHLVALALPPGGFQVEVEHLRKRGSVCYELVAAELRGPGNSTTTESNSACNEALMIG